MDIQNKLDALARSKFRSRFHLKEKDKEYIKEKGWGRSKDTLKILLPKGWLLLIHSMTGIKRLGMAIQSLSLNMPRQLAAVNACINGII